MTRSNDREYTALQTLARYSGTEAQAFEKFILLTNFPHYLDIFSALTQSQIYSGSVMRVAHVPALQLSMLDYRVGAPMAALVVDVLSYTHPQVVLMLGLCGGLHRIHHVGDYLLPVAAIRDEGASQHYMPAQVPSLPAFMVQKLISEVLLEQKLLFHTGVVHTTDYRLWEFDEHFCQRLKSEKASVIDMESSALFTVGFKRKVPIGAILLISDLPLLAGGVKTEQTAKAVFSQYSEAHIRLGMAAIKHLQNAREAQNINFRRFHFG